MQRSYSVGSIPAFRGPAADPAPPPPPPPPPAGNFEFAGPGYVAPAVAAPGFGQGQHPAARMDRMVDGRVSDRAPMSEFRVSICPSLRVAGQLSFCSLSSFPFVPSHSFIPFLQSACALVSLLRSLSPPSCHKIFRFPKSFCSQKLTPLFSFPPRFFFPASVFLFRPQNIRTESTKRLETTLSFTSETSLDPPLQPRGSLANVS